MEYPTVEQVLAETPQWDQPNLDAEQEEITRTAAALRLPLHQLHRALETGHMTTPSEFFLNQIQNTDYNAINTMDDVERFARQYGRDAYDLAAAFPLGHIPAPIVLMQNKIPYLVAGNTRMMVAKALGIKPALWVGELR